MKNLNSRNRENKDYTYDVDEILVPFGDDFYCHLFNKIKKMHLCKIYIY